MYCPYDRKSTDGDDDDAILWGNWEDQDLECEMLEVVCPKPYWSEKQTRRRGEVHLVNHPERGRKELQKKKMKDGTRENQK